MKLKRRIIIASLALALGLVSVHAQLAITEVMSGESDKNHPDWFELHNYGTNSIDLTGYSWNDDAHSGFAGADTAPFNGVTIAAGETLLVTEQKGGVTDAATFRDWWGLGPGVQVVVLASSDPGLSANGAATKRQDSVRLWNTNLAALGANTNGLDLDECSDFLVARADLGSTTNQSLLFDPASGMFDRLSTNGVDGAFAAATVGTDIGSPGVAPDALPATIAQTPLPQTATIGDSVSFTNGGTALPPLVFHWYFNGAPLTSQSNQVSILHVTPGQSDPLTNDLSILTLTDVQTNMAGTYTVIAENGRERLTNSATLTVNQSPTVPSLLSVTPNLDGFDAFVGQSVHFSVLASGYPAPVFHWRKNNADIPGETNSDYVLSLGDTNQTAVYSVIVSNTAGSTNVSFDIHVTPVPNLVITEVMPTDSEADWFELSNLGDFPVNLYGFRIDDSHNALSASATVTNRTSIQPYESVVFVQNMTPQAFRDWWGPQLPARVQIISYNGAGQGLSGGGDEVHVWNAAASTDGDQVAGVSFLAEANNVSFGFDPTVPNPTGFLGYAPDGESVVGVNGAFVAASGGDIGSPGTIVNLPNITSLTATGGGFQLAWVNQPNWDYTIQYKTNLSDANWSTLTNLTSDGSSIFNFTDRTAGAQRFYRVGLTP